MTAHVLVYIFLAIVLGFMVYIIGTPWWTPREHVRCKSPNRRHGFTRR